MEEKGNDSRVESILAKACIQMTPIERKLDETERNTELQNADQKSHDNDNLSNGVHESTEELLQTTQPNVDIFPEPKVNDNEENKEDSDI